MKDQTPIPVTVETSKSGVIRLFDCRDGQADAGSAFKVLGDLLGLPWNAWRSSGVSGCEYRGFGMGDVMRLVREAEAKGGRVLGAQVSNYGVSVAIENRR